MLKSKDYSPENCQDWNWFDIWADSFDRKEVLKQQELLCQFIQMYDNPQKLDRLKQFINKNKKEWFIIAGWYIFHKNLFKVYMRNKKGQIRTIEIGKDFLFIIT